MTTKAKCFALANQHGITIEYYLTIGANQVALICLMVLLTTMAEQVFALSLTRILQKNSGKQSMATYKLLSLAKIDGKNLLTQRSN
jgi:hypothetical protein